IALPASTSGGTFTLSFAGQTTSPVAYNASAAAMKNALESLTTIGAGNVSVTLNATSDWSVEFQGGLANTNVPLVIGDGALLSGLAAVAVSTVTPGSAPGNTKYQLVTQPSVVYPTYSFYMTGWRPMPSNPA